MKEEYKDFVGIFDGAFTNTCDKYLDYFKSLDSKGLTSSRQFKRHEVDDKSVSLTETFFFSYS